MFFEYDKPYLSLKDIENDINHCNSIKFAAYRAAAKLRVVQKAFYLDKVQLRLISCVLERHQLQQTENSICLDQKEVESVLSDIYFVIKKENGISLDVNYVSQLMFSFLLDVFGKKTSNTVQVLSIKVGLTLLCNAKPREKYHYLFEQLADHNNSFSRQKLEVVLKKMIKLTEHLGEGLSFGLNLIEGTVESCFQYNSGGLRLSEEVFMEWLMQDPQLLVWISTFYRMHISESVSHHVKCGICKIYPLVGLRYRCLRCLSYDMCQTCFFTGKLKKKHKLKHPVQEYCYPMTSQQSTKAFFLTLRNRLYKKDCKLQYLPALKTDLSDTESLGRNTNLLDEIEVSSRTVVNGSRISLPRFPYRELQNIILHLERESEEMILQIENFSLEAENSKVSECKIHLKNCLLEHKAQVKTQLERLKLLRNYVGPNVKAFTASTPVVDEISFKSKKKDLNMDLDALSPISVRTYKKKEETSCEKKMMWDNYDLGTLGSKPSWEELVSFKPKNSTSEVSKFSNSVRETNLQNNGSELELSTWLAKKTIHELNSSSREGMTWLYEKENDIENSVKEKNDATLEELQSDLKKILEKLQELSVLTSKEKTDEIESLSNKKSMDLDVTGEMDILLMDLIDGIEKIIGN